jgi:hypothetical protein
MEQETPAQSIQPTMTTVTKEPAHGEKTVQLKLTTPTPAPIHLNTILIAVSDSKHSEYAFNWVLNNVLREETIAKTKVLLLTMQNEIALPYYFEPALGSEREAYLHYYRALLRHFDKALIRKFPNANVDLLLGDGHTGEGIVTCVENQNVDWITRIGRDETPF